MFLEGTMCNCLAYRMNYMTVSQCQYLQTSTTHYSIHLQTIPDLSLHFVPVLFEIASVALADDMSQVAVSLRGPMAQFGLSMATGKLPSVPG